MIGSYIKYYTFAGADSFTINDRVNQPLLHGQAPFYYISVTSADGLYSGDISYESNPIPNATGEKAGDVFERGKTITLTGKIHGFNVGAVARGAEYLQQMFNEKALRKLVFKRLQDNIVVYYKGKVNQGLTIIESFEDGKYEWDWVVGIRTDMPFTYKLSDDTLYPTWQT